MIRKGRTGLVRGAGVFVAALSVSCLAPDPAGTEVTGNSVSSLEVYGPTCPTNSAIWFGPSKLPLSPIAGSGGVWTVQPLFAAPVPPGLVGYWSFTWSPAGMSVELAKVEPVVGGSATPDFSALATFAAAYGTAPVQRDCAGVVPLASISDTEWPTMRAKNDVRTSQLATLPASTTASSVRVAVIDSAATPYTSATADTFDHGRSVGRAIRELSCPTDSPSTSSSPCVGQISNFPALVHLDATNVNTTLGGYFGTQSELALAIVQSVTSWLAEPAATRPPHLLINMSVGWDPDQGYGGEFDDEIGLPPATSAVRAAIVHAVCNGALVVAAAGNKSTPTSSGPMYPAAWERYAAPTAAACTTFEGAATLPADPATVTYRPLLHAVAGLDAVDAPLSNTRTLGRPRMAAYGEYVVTSDSRTVHTDVLTGTSMAAANVSGIAAAAWGYKPTATANEIMELVYDNAVSLAASADFAEGTSMPIIRRASLCDAVKAASNGTFTCSTPAAFSGTPLSFNWAALDPGFAMALVPSTRLVSPSPLPTVPAALATPWVSSQPGSPSCTTCGHSTIARQTYLGTNAAPAPFHASAGILTLTTQPTSGAAVTEYYAFTPPLPSAVNAANYGVQLASSNVTGTVTSATVTWTVSGGGTTYQTTSPVVVTPPTGGGPTPVLGVVSSFRER